MLVDIVAKGGNLLLNIAPSPEGEWQEGAFRLLGEFGAWMDVNSEGIYNSNTLPPFKENNICMTQQDDGTAYFFYLVETDEKTMPATLTVQAHQPAKGSKVTLLGYDKPLEWSPAGTGFTVKIPKGLRENPPCAHAWTFKVSKLASN